MELRERCMGDGEGEVHMHSRLSVSSMSCFIGRKEEKQKQVCVTSIDVTKRVSR